jgi:hypothetical protein
LHGMVCWCMDVPAFQVDGLIIEGERWVCHHVGTVECECWAISPVVEKAGDGRGVVECWEVSLGESLG